MLNDFKWEFLGILSEDEKRKEEQETELELKRGGYSSEIIKEYLRYIRNYYRTQYYYGTTNFLCNVGLILSVINMSLAQAGDLRLHLSFITGMTSIFYGNYALNKRRKAAACYQEIKEDYNITYVKKNRR